MPAFEYEAYAPDGQRLAGHVEAASKPDAVRSLTARGLRIVRAEEISSRAPPSHSFRLSLARNPSLSDLSELLKELSVLLNAGLAIDDALRATMAQSLNPTVRRLTQGLLDGVVAGDALSATFQRNAPAAPPYLVPLLKAGEARGALPATLAELASYIEAQAETRARIRSALTYPLVLAVAAIATVAIIIAVLVPSLLPLFEGTRAAPPVVLVLADQLGHLLARFWLGLLAVALVLALATRALLRRDRVLTSLHRWMLGWPLVGAYSRASNLTVLGRTLGTLLHNGVGLIPALGITAAVASNRSYSADLEAAAQAVREGGRLATSLADRPGFPPIAIRFIAIGEESSRLADMLLHLGQLFEKQNQRRMERFLAILTPALTISIGLLVGGLILSVMQAILSVNQLAFG